MRKVLVCVSNLSNCRENEAVKEYLESRFNIALDNTISEIPSKIKTKDLDIEVVVPRESLRGMDIHTLAFTSNALAEYSDIIGNVLTPSLYLKNKDRYIEETLIRL